MRRALLDDARSARANDRCLDIGVQYRLHTDLNGYVLIYVGLVACRDQDAADIEIQRLADGGAPGVPSDATEQEEAS